MKFPDLFQFPAGHPPSPYETPVKIFKVGEVNLPAGLQLFAIGWIEEPGFSTGKVPDECIDALFAAYPGKIVPDGTRGVQTCTLCQSELPKITWKGKKVDLAGNGHYLVRNKQAVYMAPALLLHYILDHQYCPPPVLSSQYLRGNF